MIMHKKTIIVLRSNIKDDSTGNSTYNYHIRYDGPMSHGYIYKMTIEAWDKLSTALVQVYDVEYTEVTH